MRKNDLESIKEIQKLFNLVGYKDIDEFYDNNIENMISLKITKEILMNWQKSFLVKEINNDIRIIRDSITLDTFVDRNKLFFMILADTELFSCPSNDVCEKIIQLIHKLQNCKVKNFGDFKGLKEGSTLWDAHVRHEIYQFEPQIIVNFQIRYINDKDLFDGHKLYCPSKKVPFDTNRRFTGFLAYLFYSGFYDLYESVFDILVKTILDNQDVCKELINHLSSFCFECDKKNYSILKEKLLTLKKKN